MQDPGIQLLNLILKLADEADPELADWIRATPEVQEIAIAAGPQFAAKRAARKARQASQGMTPGQAWDVWGAAIEALPADLRKRYTELPSGMQPSTLEELGVNGLPPGFAWKRDKSAVVGDPLFDGKPADGKVAPGAWIWRGSRQGPVIYLVVDVQRRGGEVVDLLSGASAAPDIVTVWRPGYNDYMKISSLGTSIAATERVERGQERTGRTPHSYIVGSGTSTGQAAAFLSDVFPDPADRRTMYNVAIRGHEFREAEKRRAERERQQEAERVGPWFVEIEREIVAESDGWVRVPDTVEAKALRKLFRAFGVKASIRVRRYSMASGLDFGPLSKGKTAWTDQDIQNIQKVVPRWTPRTSFGSLYPGKTEDRSDLQTDYHDPGGFRVSHEAVPYAKFYLAEAAKKAGLPLTAEGKRVLAAGDPKKKKRKSSRRSGSRSKASASSSSSPGNFTIRYVARKGDWVNISTVEDGKNKRYGWSISQQRWARDWTPARAVVEEAVKHAKTPEEVEGVENALASFPWPSERRGGLRSNPSHHVEPAKAHPNVQSVLFSKDRWSVTKARSWLKDHDYQASNDRFDIAGGDYIRVRQADPGSFERLRTITFGKGIKAIVGYGKKARKNGRRRNSRDWIEHTPGLPKDTFEAFGGPDKWTRDRARLHAGILDQILDQRPAPKGTRPQAIVMMGGPASGKSSALRGLDTQGLVHLDSDDIKARLPEYLMARAANARDAAAMVHEESSYLVKRALAEAIDRRLNLVFDGTGKNAKKYERMIKQLKASGYDVKLLFTHALPELAIDRAMTRAEETGRYVPEHVIRGAYEQIPFNFGRLSRVADSWLLFDTSEWPARLVATRPEGGKRQIKRKDLWDAYLEDFPQAGGIIPNRGQGPSRKAGKPAINTDSKRFAGRIEEAINAWLRSDEDDEETGLDAL